MNNKKLKNTFSNQITKISRKFGKDIFGRSDKTLKPNRSGKPGGNLLNTRQRRESEYALFIRQKTTVQKFYNVKSKQLKSAVKMALKKQLPEEYLVNFLESQLCCVIFRAGMARTMRGASQLISHGHVSVNGRPVNIKSFKCKLGDEIVLSKEMLNNNHIKMSMDKSQLSSHNAEWLSIKDNKILVMQNPCRANTKHWVDINFSDIVNT